MSVCFPPLESQTRIKYLVEKMGKIKKKKTGILTSFQVGLCRTIINHYTDRDENSS